MNNSIEVPGPEPTAIIMRYIAGELASGVYTNTGGEDRDTLVERFRAAARRAYNATHWGQVDQPEETAETYKQAVRVMDLNIQGEA